MVFSFPYQGDRLSQFSWILFRSHATVAPWPVTMLDIVRATERNNAQSGATGMLVFSTTGYLQYLEGPHAVIEATWVRITSDTRHRLAWNVMGKVGAPRFPGLPLGYFDAAREQATVQAGPLWSGRNDWSASQAEALVAMLQQIAREKYPTTMAGGAG